MQVILQQDVKGVGKKGELVEVSEGYGRNFLLKKKLALTANSVNKNVANQAKQAQEFHRQELLKEYAQIAEKIKDITLKFSVKVGENGKLFGSVTSKEIADKLSEKGYEIDKRKIEIENIKTVGKYQAKVRFAPNIETTFFVEIESA